MDTGWYEHPSFCYGIEILRGMHQERNHNNYKSNPALAVHLWGNHVKDMAVPPLDKIAKLCYLYSVR